MCSVDSCKSSTFKKDEEKQSEKIDCPVHQIQKCKKKQDYFRVCSFYIHSKSDVNTISDLIRVEKYVDNNIQIFNLLWEKTLKKINVKKLNKWKGKKWMPW